jgi:alpha-tubulin suppressor-like RCC1 family protein
MTALAMLWLGVSPIQAANVPVALGWGLDDHGQLGQGSQVVFPTPTPIDQTGALAGKTVVKTVSGGRHVLALTADGKVYAWGDNSSRQLGNNSNIHSSSPVEVMAAPGSELIGKTVIDIAATQNTSLLVTSDFQLWGWGTGALGGPNSTLTGLPIRINSGALSGKNVPVAS